MYLFSSCVVSVEEEVAPVICHHHYEEGKHQYDLKGQGHKGNHLVLDGVGDSLDNLGEQVEVEEDGGEHVWV